MELSVEGGKVPGKSLNPLSGSADGGELVPASQPLCLFIGQFLGRSPECPLRNEN